MTIEIKKESIMKILKIIIHRVGAILKPTVVYLWFAWLFEYSLSRILVYTNGYETLYDCDPMYYKDSFFGYSLPFMLIFIILFNIIKFSYRLFVRKNITKWNIIWFIINVGIVFYGIFQ